jgi:hypothetical protein
MATGSSSFSVSAASQTTLIPPFPQLFDRAEPIVVAIGGFGRHDLDHVPPCQVLHELVGEKPDLAVRAVLHLAVGSGRDLGKILPLEDTFEDRLVPGSDPLPVVAFWDVEFVVLLVVGRPPADLGALFQRKSADLVPFHVPTKSLSRCPGHPSYPPSRAGRKRFRCPRRGILRLHRLPLPASRGRTRRS